MTDARSTSTTEQDQVPGGGGAQVFETRKQYSVLSMNTLAFTVNFAVWTMFSVIGIRIKSQLGLNDTEFGLLVATPILTGSLTRLPLGILTDRFGGRAVFFIQMILVAIPTYGLAFATQYWQYLVIGLFIGLAGGSFAIGIAYTSAWFPKEKQGTAMGIFGAGNAGAAVTNLVAPLIIVASAGAWCRRSIPSPCWRWRCCSGFSPIPIRSSKSAGARRAFPTLGDQLAPLTEMRVWRFGLAYYFVFGGFVALALWLPKYYVAEYGLDAALRRLHHHAVHAALRRHPRPRRLDLRQVRRQHHDLVGVLGRHRLSVLPLLPADHAGGSRHQG